MEPVLLVSATETAAALLRPLLDAAGCRRIVTARTGGDARRRAAAENFALILIDAPLPDGTGAALARQLAGRTTGQVLLLTAGPPPQGLEEAGVLTLAKPVSRAQLAAALGAVSAAQRRIRALEEENRLLKGRMEDVRLVGRAKCILMTHMHMREPEAHRYIEKQAMDRRTTRRAIAEGILKTYEN